MTAADLKRIEGGLGIAIPKDYRKLMLSRGAKLNAVGLGDILFLEADNVIITNLAGSVTSRANKGVGPGVDGKVTIDANPLLTKDTLVVWRHGA